MPKGKSANPGAVSADPDRERLRAQVGVEAHLARVGDLLSAYDLGRAVQPNIHAILDRMGEHEREERLFLGVVGEFSSGKSTLLNALLREDLLRAEIVQGTTAAATLLSYGPELAVAVLPLPGHPAVEPFLAVGRWVQRLVLATTGGGPKDRESLRALIQRASAVEEVSRKVAQVNVSHPADCLRNGMVIVDLPGTNAENPRHGGVTSAALADLCDAALIVVPADAPGSETLWRFLQEHTSPDVLRRCVFVLNKIDLIRRPGDRDQLVANLKSRLARDLKIDVARVVVAAPERVLEASGIYPPADAVDFAMTEDEKARWVASFGEAERVLWATLREQKLLLQVERLARLLAEVLEMLDAVLHGRDAAYRDRHAALEAGLAQIPDLGRFVAEAQQRHNQAFVSAVGPAAERCWSSIFKVQAEAMRSVSNAILQTSGKKELQAALDGPVKSALGQTESKLRRALKAGFREMEQAAEREHRAFHDHFQGYYRNLATLGGRVRAESRGMDSQPAARFDAKAGGTTRELSAGVAGQLMGDYVRGAGGAGIGATLGTIALPGLGTLIGGVVGGLFASLFGPRFAEIRKECLDKLEAAITAGFLEFNEQAKANLPQAASQVEQSLNLAIGRYAEGYRQLVAEMIARDGREAEDLNRFRRQIQADLADIRRRLQDIAGVRAHLRSL